MTSSTWFLTGASRGLGRELTEQLLARGERVAATARRPEALDDLAAAHPDRLWVRALDVTDAAAVRRVVAGAFSELGRIDVVVSNAGYGVFGAAEDLDDAHIEGMIATNLTGSIHVARSAVGHLRGQGGGTLLQVSSMGAQLAFPAFSMYHATKWGIEGFYEALAQEVAPFGIRCLLVEPGMVATSFYDAAERVPASAAYRGGPADRQPIPVEDMPGDQARTAAGIIAAAGSADGPDRVLLGSDAYRLVTGSLTARLEELVPQAEVAARADRTAA